MIKGWRKIFIPFAYLLISEFSQVLLNHLEFENFLFGDAEGLRYLLPLLFILNRMVKNK